MSQPTKTFEYEDFDKSGVSNIKCWVKQICIFESEKQKWQTFRRRERNKKIVYGECICNYNIMMLCKKKGVYVP